MPGSPQSRLFAALLAALVGCTGAEGPTTTEAGSPYLYLWAGDLDHDAPDFLAVLDVTPASPRYGHLVTTVPVDGRGNYPHHTEYELTPGQLLFANAWGTGRTFLFDLSRPAEPRVAGAFAARGGYAYPHSFVRLPNGNVLATFQAREGGYEPPGGVVELDPQGNLVRSASAATPETPDAENWPYSMLVLPDIDRVIVTSTRMGLPEEWAATGDSAANTAGAEHSHTHAHDSADSRHLQVWRLSDLTLTATVVLPEQDGGHNLWSAEPRRLANGDVYVNTFSCGLYRLSGLDTARPQAHPVHASRFDGERFCAVPAVVGNFWIQPSATENAIVTYDLGNPAATREVARLHLGPDFPDVHWLALDPVTPRLVVTADPQTWVLIVKVDPDTGALAIDERFREEGADRPGFWFDRVEWPHGAGGPAAPHGAVFGPDATGR
jgi:hypothetical protein